MLDSNTSLLRYEATQDAMCGGMQAPAKMYASSIDVKRNGKWMGMYHQETAGMAMK
jgi:nitrogenase subunit NifH